MDALTAITKTIDDVVEENRRIHSLDPADCDPNYPGYWQKERWLRSSDDCATGLRTLLRLLQRMAAEDPQFRQAAIDRLRSITMRGGHEQTHLDQHIRETLIRLEGRSAEIRR